MSAVCSSGVRALRGILAEGRRLRVDVVDVASEEEVVQPTRDEVRVRARVRVRVRVRARARARARVRVRVRVGVGVTARVRVSVVQPPRDELEHEGMHALHRVEPVSTRRGSAQGV